MENYEITKERILRLFEVSREGGFAVADRLRAWFPSAFEEWEEVPLAELLFIPSEDGKAYLSDGRGYVSRVYLTGDYKIESGRILRRKSAG
jgi:hypothetical protein